MLSKLGIEDKYLVFFGILVVAQLCIKYLPPPLHWWAMGIGLVLVLWELCQMLDEHHVKGPFEPRDDDEGSP